MNEEEIFQVALALPVEERSAYLDAACEGHPEIRTRLGRMLSDEEKDEFMRAETQDVSAEAEAMMARLKPEEAGERIGRYKLREQIGEGGFGTVWVAEQEEPVKRRVALKIIKMGMDTKEVIARFEQERQALALMDHPNIAKVLDAGATEWGRPFFVMELVRGIKITHYCDQANLPTTERLELFVAVCRAVQHAHQKGIIHRDLKPSNILVTMHDGVPVPKVIDFGVAKATQARFTDLTIYTQFQQMIGTPLYMSPEQAEMSGLDIDTRSDIYSLGVLLYELLTGRTPVDADTLLRLGLDEIRRIIREQEAPRPSTVLRTMAPAVQTNIAHHRHIELPKLIGLLRGDLDWIVMKALEKDRTRRYETANGLAMDIKRHLADEPVLARPPSQTYRFRRFVRRNRLGVVAGSVVVLTLVAGLSFSTWMFWRERAALKTAVIAEDVARTRLAESEKARAEATAARQSATAAEAVAQTRFEQSEAARAEAAAISQFFVKIFRSPEPTRDGRTITVAEMLDRASVELETGLAAQPGRRANMQKTLGETYHALGLPAAAVPLLEGVKDYFIKTHGAEHPETLGAIVNLANSCGASGRKDEALRLREQALTLSRKIFGLEDPSTFGAMTNLAVSYAGTGRKEEAMKMLEEVVAFDRKALRPGHPDTLLALNNLALLYNEANRQNEGTAMLEEVLHHREKSLGHQHPDTLMALGNLANSYATAGHIDQALTMREQVLSSLRTSLGPEHPDTLLAFHNLAMSYDETGRKDEAKTLRQEVKAIEEKKQAAKEKSLPSRAQMQPYDLPTLRARANRQARFGQWKEAIADKVRVLELDPSDHSEWYLLAPLLVRAGDTDAYRKHRRDMIERFGATTDLPTMERTAKASLLLPAEGAELEMLGKLADAAVSLGQNHRYLAYFQFAQGLAQYRRGQFREAIVTQRIVVAASGVPEREVQAFAVLAMAHQHLGQSSEAHAALARGEEMGTALPPNSDDDDLGGNWQDVLIAKLLLQEAKTLLDEK